MTLYNCKAEIDRDGIEHYRITKFDSDLNVEASYNLNGNACDCPAGPRPSCRHRKMLPRFLRLGATHGQTFYDYERDAWRASEFGNIAEGVRPIATETKLDLPSLPDGVIMLGLDDTRLVHNTIAEALGEPTLPPRGFTRRV